ncbi:DUF4864 domain-containing protein [Nioella nitratireducens]|uniref:DUF4864 domain-containing protein n=1 Tax=Nioella nitratireducens TaxID=1287720 RepID=UPI0008FD444F|nr:DUF4864 domain-containing protein [Nioella nitratireducens]
MRKFLLIFTLLVMPLGAMAQERLPANPDIEGVIQSQLDAFSTNSVYAAWRYASPRIQELFGSAEAFGVMVERGYPMVWRPGETTFLGLRQEGELQVQQVQIVDPTGRLHLLDYAMTEVDGDWRIAAVTVLRGQGVGA